MQRDWSAPRHYLLLTLRMKIDPAYFALDLVEANVIEAFEAGPRYSPDPMVWHKKVLLPSHKYVLTLCGVCDSDGTFPRMLQIRPESAEL